MQVDIVALKKRITACGLNQQDVARLLSVDKSTFSRKMKNRAESFSVGEMHKIAEILNLTNDEAKNIFLT